MLVARSLEQLFKGFFTVEMLEGFERTVESWVEQKQWAEYMEKSLHTRKVSEHTQNFLTAFLRPNVAQLTRGFMNPNGEFRYVNSATARWNRHTALLAAASCGKRGSKCWWESWMKSEHARTYAEKKKSALERKRKKEKQELSLRRTWWWWWRWWWWWWWWCWWWWWWWGGGGGDHAAQAPHLIGLSQHPIEGAARITDAPACL